MTTPLITVTPEPAAINAAGPAAAWSRRVRRIGGFIQAAFAAFWLTRASLAIGGRTGDLLIAVSAVAVIGVFSYAIKVTAGTAPRPAGRKPGGSSGWLPRPPSSNLSLPSCCPSSSSRPAARTGVLPSIVITIGPLLLYLDHLVHIPRYRPVGWALIAGPSCSSPRCRAPRWP